MNLDIVNDFDKIVSFLKNLINQLSLYNSINSDDLKLLCYIVYKQDTIERIKEVQPYLTTTLGYINQDTRIYFNKEKQLDSFDEISSSCPFALFCVLFVAYFWILFLK